MLYGRFWGWLLCCVMQMTSGKCDLMWTAGGLCQTSGCSTCGLAVRSCCTVGRPLRCTGRCLALHCTVSMFGSMCCYHTAADLDM